MKKNPFLIQRERESEYMEKYNQISYNCTFIAFYLQRRQILSKTIPWRRFEPETN